MAIRGDQREIQETGALAAGFAVSAAPAGISLGLSLSLGGLLLLIGP